jgi:hypothetical protein
MLLHRCVLSCCCCPPFLSLPLQASAAWLPAIFKCSKPSANPTTTIATGPVPPTSQPANAAQAAATAVGYEPPSPVCSDEVDKASCNDKAGCVWCEKGIMGMCFSQVRPAAAAAAAASRSTRSLAEKL